MKKKHPPVDLENFALIPAEKDDSDLPPPRGRYPKKKTADPWEEIKLQETKDFGGLVPERSPVLDRLCALLGDKNANDKD